MFGLKRRKALAAISENVRPLVTITQHNLGLPADFWTDSFVLGFFGTLISHHAKLATRGKLTGEDFGYVLQDGFANISGMNGVELMRRYSELAQANDPDFDKGADNAVYFACFVMGVLKDEENYPEVRTAMSIHRGDRMKASPHLFEAWFLVEIENRFGLGE